MRNYYLMTLLFVEVHIMWLTSSFVVPHDVRAILLMVLVPSLDSDCEG